MCIYVGAREGRLEFGGVVKQVRLLDLVTEAMGSMVATGPSTR